MGGRGASSGISAAGKKYGTEYHSVLKIGNIKFLVQNGDRSIKTPMETMTKGRVYATIGKQNNPISLTYYDTQGKRIKQIDLTHFHNGKNPHVHLGYEHDEKGNRGLLPKEKQMVARVLRIWNNRNNRS